MDSETGAHSKECGLTTQFSAKIVALRLAEPKDKGGSHGLCDTENTKTEDNARNQALSFARFSRARYTQR